MNLYILYVFLASNEWGNELMEKIAGELLKDDKYADKQPMTVEVHEHGGWFLQYALIKDKVMVVGTANDRAQFEGDKKLWRDKVKNYRPVSIGTIRRDSAARPETIEYVDLEGE